MTANDAYQRAKSYAKKAAREAAEGAGVMKGDPGKSAYEIWLEAGHTGTQAQFLDSLKGEDGHTPILDATKSGLKTSFFVDSVLKAVINDGLNGENGKSAYELAVAAGYTGTQEDWLNAQKGADGVGIADLSKTSTAGNIDTYTFTMTDGSTASFTVHNATEGALTKLSQLENDEDFIKATVANLTNYYTKTETYTKAEVEEIVGRVTSGLTTSIVTELPTEDISTTKIYLIRVGETNNYTQYMYIENAWANLGSTAINLENFYTKTEIDALLANYPTFSEMATAIAEALADYAKTNDLADVAFSGNYEDLKNLPSLPNLEAYEEKAHAEQTYAKKTDLDDITQIDDETTSASKTWSSQKTNTEIDKAKIVEVADRAAYEQIRANAELYSAEKFYAFPEDDSLCIIHDDKELTGKSNTLQLGEPVAVTFPFTATADGLLLYHSTSMSGTSTYGAGLIRTRDGVDETFGSSGIATYGQSGTLLTLKGDSWREVISGRTVATFTPFVPTTGETVEQSYDPTSVLPISGVGVANALVGKMTRKTIASLDVNKSATLTLGLSSTNPALLLVGGWWTTGNGYWQLYIIASNPRNNNLVQPQLIAHGGEQDLTANIFSVSDKSLTVTTGNYNTFVDLVQ